MSIEKNSQEVEVQNRELQEARKKQMEKSASEHKDLGNKLEQNGTIDHEGERKQLDEGMEVKSSSEDESKLEANRNVDDSSSPEFVQNKKDVQSEENKLQNLRTIDYHKDTEDTSETLDKQQETGKNQEKNFQQIGESTQPEKLDRCLEAYFQDLKKRSECPKSIKEQPFASKDLRKLSPEEAAEKRSEFDDKKTALKRQWEADNGQAWPKYDNDVYSSKGKIIRKAGGDYDAHHIQPLCMGGENESSNITPLHAKEHYDRQGIHSPNSPYSELDKMLR